MRIAFAVPSLGSKEGQGSVNLALLRRIVAAGHEVDVFASNAPADLGGATLRRVPRLPAWQLGNQMLALGTTTAWMRAHRYDIVHADAGVTMRAADVLVCHTLSDRWRSLPPEVWEEPGVRGRHASAATRFKAKLELRQARRARAVVVASRGVAGDLAERGVDPERIVAIPFGVDAARFRPPDAAERAAARAAFHIPHDAFVTCFVGAHGPRKGLPFALESLAGGAPDEMLLVAGEHRGGEWARFAQERSLPVRMPGKLDDVRAAYWAADALVYPSVYDAFGMAVLEAMACGLPVVVSREAGAHECVRDAGFVLSELSSRALRAAVDALRADRTRAQAMGRRARELAMGRDWDEPARILLDLYEELHRSALGRTPTAA